MEGKAKAFAENIYLITSNYRAARSSVIPDIVRELTRFHYKNDFLTEHL